MALRSGVMFAAFGTYFVKAFACCSVMSEFIAFVALDQLELRVVHLWVESLMINVESVFDGFICCAWAGEENYEGEVSGVLFGISS